jgi:hypothetical protein
MTENATPPSGTPPKPGTEGPYIPQELQDLLDDLKQARIDHGIATGNYRKKDIEVSEKEFAYAKAKSEDRPAAKAEWDRVKGERAGYKKEYEDLDQLISDLNDEINEYEMTPSGFRRKDRLQNQNYQKMPALPGIGEGKPAAEGMAVKVPTASAALPGTGVSGLPGSSEITSLLSGNGGGLNYSLKPVSPVVPRYEEPLAQQGLSIESSPPKTFNGKLAVPTLVRLDQQPLSLAEKMYPAMGYDDHVYEPWSDEVKQQVQTKNPDFAKQQAAIQPRIPDSPADLDDPDYFPLPENPRFMDLYHHDVWKKKKLL